jgi:hypothetical protein
MTADGEQEEVERVRVWIGRLREFASSLDDVDGEKPVDICENACGAWQAIVMADRPPPTSPAMALIVQSFAALTQVMTTVTMDWAETNDLDDLLANLVEHYETHARLVHHSGGAAHRVRPASNATLREFVPHGVVLYRSVCAVTHGGMGVTQKALNRGVPVCVVPFGRDQFETARRVEVAHCGARLPAKKLTPARLRAKVREAMTMTDGAKRVAAGFTATGGVARGADLIEQRVLGRIGRGLTT